MENLRSNNKKILTDNKQDLNLQILDWFAEDEEVETDNSSDSEGDNMYKVKEYRYIIKLFCNTIEGHSVSVKVTDFPPYFYVHVPDNWDKPEVKKFVSAIKDRLSPGKSKSGNGLIWSLDDILALVS